MALTLYPFGKVCPTDKESVVPPKATKMTWLPSGAVILPVNCRFNGGGEGGGGATWTGFGVVMTGAGATAMAKGSRLAASNAGRSRTTGKGKAGLDVRIAALCELALPEGSTGEDAGAGAATQAMMAIAPTDE